MEERRRVPRYLAEVAAELSLAGGESPSRVVIEILSIQGGCIRGQAIPAKGEKCRLSLAWQGERIHADAEVAWRSHQGMAGIRFLSLDDKSRETLRDLLATLRMQPVIPGKME